jgi:hypothetical protein
VEIIEIAAVEKQLLNEHREHLIGKQKSFAGQFQTITGKFD